MAVGSRFLCRSPVKPRPARVQTPYRARPNIVQVQARPCFAFMQRPACLPACLFQARRCCFAALSVCLLSSTRSNSVHTMSETYAAAAAAATRTFPAWPAFSQFKPALVCFQTPVDGSFKLQAEHTSLGSSSSDGRTDGDDSLLAGTLQQRAGLFFPQARRFCRCCFAALSVCLLSSTRSNSVHTMSKTSDEAAATATATTTRPFQKAVAKYSQGRRRKGQLTCAKAEQAKEKEADNSLPHFLSHKPPPSRKH